jgi:hypothetical protein
LSSILSPNARCSDHSASEIWNLGPLLHEVSNFGEMASPAAANPDVKKKSLLFIFFPPFHALRITLHVLKFPDPHVPV